MGGGNTMMPMMLQQGMKGMMIPKGMQMVWQPMFQKKKGKGKGKDPKPFCIDMKLNGFCPRGDDCKYCGAMIERYGTNDWSDTTCWDVKTKGECTRKFCNWCPDKPDTTPGMGKSPKAWTP